MTKMTDKNSQKSAKKLLDAQVLFRVTSDEKIKFKNKAKKMDMKPSKILRDFVRYSDKLQYLFSHDDAQQFTASLGRLNGQINRMSYELNRINNHAGLLSNNTLNEVKDLLNEVGGKYDKILTAIYGNIQPTEITTQKDRNSLPSYASDYTRSLAKQLASDRQKLTNAVANGADPDERRMLQDNVSDTEEALHDSLAQDKREHKHARK
jgi:hypothetical protein